MLFQLPRECRVFAKISPAAQWGWQEIFLNKTTYLLELVLWQNTQVKKGQLASHNRRKPKPYVPDFMKSELPVSEINKDSEKHTVDDIKRLLAMPRGPIE